MTPTKVVLEQTLGGLIQLRVYALEPAKGFVVVESVKFVTGMSIAGLRKQGEQHAKRLSVPFHDRTAAP
jgi:hypothetical protein